MVMGVSVMHDMEFYCFPFLGVYKNWEQVTVYIDVKAIPGASDLKVWIMQIIHAPYQCM